MSILIIYFIIAFILVWMFSEWVIKQRFWIETLNFFGRLLIQVLAVILIGFIIFIMVQYLSFGHG